MQPLSRSLFAVLSLLAVSLPTSVVPVLAAGYPDKPIRLIIPFPPGGSNDILGRYLGAKLTDRLGQQIVIDNRGGANGIIGAELAANSTPDGHTLLFVSTSWVMNAAVRPLPYDVEKSFDPISMIGSSPNSIVVHPKGPYGKLRDIVDQAKAKPGSVNYAHTGVGGFNHFGGELFNRVAGIKMQHVPYKGGGPAMIDIIAGNIPVMFTSVTQVLGHVRAGRIKMLAIGSEKRSPAVPDIPTVGESGFPGYEVAVWWGVAAPAGAPGAALRKLNGEITAVLREPETQKRLLADAAEPKIMTPAELRKLIHNDVKKWREVAKVAGIQIK
jgi:tripartite-type tricarboxylate transporter receptor subunit TctC